MRGTVKWFGGRSREGRPIRFGWIKSKERDVFVHQNDVEKSGLENLVEGDEVEFDIGKSPRGGDTAINLRLCHPAAATADARALPASILPAYPLTASSG